MNCSMHASVIDTATVCLQGVAMRPAYMLTWLARFWTVLLRIYNEHACAMADTSFCWQSLKLHPDA